VPAPTPFTDPALIRGPLYAAPDRLRQRTNALHRAKIDGADATTTIVGLANDIVPAATTVIDVGCGRGTSTVHLAHRYPGATVVGIDQSPGLLSVTAHRLCAEGIRPAVVVGDFHDLPIATARAELAVASFCLYHSALPRQALIEIARCLRPGGVLIVTTKSADSYHDIDNVIARAGLDPVGAHRPSLYATFHSANAEPVMRTTGLTVRRRVDQLHTFHFPDSQHLADYVATCPKYRLRDRLSADPTQLGAALATWIPEAGVTTTSTVTYLVADRA
jgi:ubiquinone/menaquinone biosynthesis C-methylase UbiE